MSRVQAVLFDMDGLLIDSEPEWFEVERAVFERLGASRPWSHTDASAMVGNTLEVSARQMRHLAGSAVPVGVVVDWFVEGMQQRLRHGVPWKPGALDLLASLRAEAVRCALVSSSYRALLDTVLGQLPPGTFATSVAGDEVSRGKPHPDPYLLALRRLGVRAQEAIVLEDSPTGATAGRAAGCTVVVVPDLAALPEPHPWVEVTSLEQLDVTVLRALLGGDRSQHVEVRRAPRRDDGGEHPHES